ncbi:response regulator [Brevibacillus sp. SYP-B805]|uniref:response regulator n=1 Tax=Brevibacillus sp. SYP-B805 TaxID=1578199 RepID=UPI0013EC2FC1|nr:response regulator [Brevibacillus sp. SYP-B805]
MTKQTFRVVIIEDDPMVQEVNRQFIEKVPYFSVAGVAGNGADGVEMVKRLKPDLVIMDIFMPVSDGIKTIRRLRAENQAVDVIVITAAKDSETIHAMLRHGAVDYIIKPFTFERIRQALENYRRFRLQLQAEGEMSQAHLDQLLHRREGGSAFALEDLPKGLNPVTLQQIIDYLSRQSAPLSAEEVAEHVGIARVTARRYLDYLEKNGRVRRAVEYGGIGRPTHRYVMCSRP